MRWPRYQHVFFDCDSTLTTVEGIDILADSAGKAWRIGVLTDAAMRGDLELEDVYERRLEAIKPTRGQIQAIRSAYKRNVVEDAAEVIAALQRLGHDVYIISGGLLEPVREFGLYLGVPKEHIRAVGVTYNELSGEWWVDGEAQYLMYEEGALTVSDGKAAIVAELLAGKDGRSALIGDGFSDLAAGRAVDLFVGFGGVVNRPAVREQAPVFIQSASLAPFLAVAAGPTALRQRLDTPFDGLTDKAFELLERGAISFNDERLKAKFFGAVDASRETFHSGPGRGQAGDSGRPSAMDDWASNAGVR
jgi:phosphoserine phosphatase